MANSSKPSSRPDSVGRRAPRTSRATLSLDSILDAAIGILDREGVPGLTLRGLAEELGGGVGSIYWYVRGKDELVDRATDAILRRAYDDLLAMRAGTLDPAAIGADGEITSSDREVALALTETRRICLALFHQLHEHSWAAPRLVGNGVTSEYAIRLFDQLGRQLLDLELSRREIFYGASTLLTYVTGIAAEMQAQGEQFAGDGRPFEDLVDGEIDRWREVGRDETPFLDAVADQFRTHDDHSQFVSGLDLILSGLREQAER